MQNITRAQWQSILSVVGVLTITRSTFPLSAKNYLFQRFSAAERGNVLRITISLHLTHHQRIDLELADFNRLAMLLR